MKKEWQQIKDDLLIEEYRKLVWQIEMDTVHLKKLESRFESLRAYCLDKGFKLPSIEDILKLNG